MGSSTDAEKRFLHELVREAYPAVYERCMKRLQGRDRRRVEMSGRKRRVSYDPGAYAGNGVEETIVNEKPKGV